MDKNSKDGKAQATASKGRVGESSGKSSNVRKSSRSRKRSKKVLDSADVDLPELDAPPAKKKATKKIASKKTRKDFLENGRPFVCSLCNSKCINPSRVRRKDGPVYKERDGQTLQLCIDCGIAVSHTETKGPTQEQKQEFEREGREFAQHLAKYLGDNEAIRLYCSFYALYKCGCIQNFIHGGSQTKRKKYSCSDPDIPDLLPEECFDPPDDKADQAQKARYLLQLLKESKKKKNLMRSMRSRTSSNQSVSSVRSVDSQSGGDTDTGSTSCGVASQSGDQQDQRVVHQKRLENFILVHRSKLKKIGICERGCQRVLCYSNNFLHKKSVFGKEARLQRTKGKAALGQLDAVEDLPNFTCCEKACVKFAALKPGKVAQWRHQAQQSQRESWKVISEILTSPQITGGHHHSCFRFITLVTGCCLATVRKVYAETLLAKGRVVEREHGLRYHWRRQKQGVKSLSESSTGQDKPELSALKFKIAQQTASTLAGDLLGSVPTHLKGPNSKSSSQKSHTASLRDTLEPSLSLSSSYQVGIDLLPPSSLRHTVSDQNCDAVKDKSTLSDTVMVAASVQSILPSQNVQVFPVQTTGSLSQPVGIAVCVSSSSSSCRPQEQSQLRTLFSQPYLQSPSALLAVGTPLVISAGSGLRNPSQVADILQQVPHSQQQLPVQTSTIAISYPQLTQFKESQSNTSSTGSISNAHTAPSSVPEQFTHSTWNSPKTMPIGLEKRLNSFVIEPQSTSSNMQRGVHPVQNFLPVSQVGTNDAAVIPTSLLFTENQPSAGGTSSQVPGHVADLSSSNLVQQLLSCDSQIYNMPVSTLPSAQASKDSLSNALMPSSSSNMSCKDLQSLASNKIPNAINLRNSDKERLQNVEREADGNIHRQALQGGQHGIHGVKQSSQQIPSQPNVQYQEQEQNEANQNGAHHNMPSGSHTVLAQDVPGDQVSQQEQPRILGLQDCTLIKVLVNGVPKMYVVPKNPESSSSASSSSLTASMFSTLPPTAIPLDGSLLAPTQTMEAVPGLSQLLSQTQVMPSQAHVSSNQPDTNSGQPQAPANQSQDKYSQQQITFDQSGPLSNQTLVTSSQSQASCGQSQIISSQPTASSNQSQTANSQFNVISREAVALSSHSYITPSHSHIYSSISQVLPHQTDPLPVSQMGLSTLHTDTAHLQGSTPAQNSKFNVVSDEPTTGETYIPQTSQVCLYPSIPSDLLQPLSHALSNPTQTSLFMSSGTDQIVSSKPRVSSVVQASPRFSNTKSLMKTNSIDLVNFSSSSCGNSEVNMSTLATENESSQNLLTHPKLDIDIQNAIKSALSQRNYQTNTSTDGLNPHVQPYVIGKESSLDDTIVSQAPIGVIQNKDPTLPLPSDPSGSVHKPETGDSQSGSPVFVPRGDNLARNLSMDGASTSSDLMFHPVTCSPNSVVFDALSDSPMNYQHISSIFSEFMMGSCRRLSFSGHSVSGPHTQTTLTSPIQPEFFSKLFTSTRSGSSSSSRQSPVQCISSSHQMPANQSLPTLAQVPLVQVGEDRLARLITNTSPVCGSEGMYTTPSAFTTQLTPSAGESFHHPSAMHSSSSSTMKTSDAPTIVSEANESELLSALTKPKVLVVSDRQMDQASNVTKSSAHEFGEINMNSQASSTNTAMSQVTSCNGASMTEPRSGFLLQKLLSNDPVTLMHTLPQSSSSIIKPAVSTETTFIPSGASMLGATQMNLPSANPITQEQATVINRNGSQTQVLATSTEMLSTQQKKIEKANFVAGTRIEKEKSNVLHQAAPVSDRYGAATLGNLPLYGNALSSGQEMHQQPPISNLLHSTASISTPRGPPETAIKGNLTRDKTQSVPRIKSQHDLQPVQNVSEQQDFSSLLGQHRRLHQVDSPCTVEPMHSNVNVNTYLQNTVSMGQQPTAPIKPMEIHSSSGSDPLPQTFQVVSANGQKQQLVFLPQQLVQEKSQQLILQPQQLVQQQLPQLSQHAQLLQEPSQPSQQQQPAQNSQQRQLPSQQPQQMQPLFQEPQQQSGQTQLLSQRPQHGAQPHQFSQQPNLTQVLSQQPQELSQPPNNTTPMSQQSQQVVHQTQPVSEQPQQQSQVLRQIQPLSQLPQGQLQLQSEVQLFSQVQLHQPAQTVMLSQELQQVLQSQQMQSVVLQTQPQERHHVVVQAQQVTQPLQQPDQTQQLQLRQEPQQVLQQFTQQVLPSVNQSTQSVGEPQHLTFSQEQSVSKTSTSQISTASNIDANSQKDNSSTTQHQTSDGNKWMTVPISVTTPGPPKPPKQRRLMPKLAPIPQQLKTKPKSSFILVPDKPGYPSLPLSSVDPKGLSWLTPGQTVQIRTITPQAEPMRGSGGQPILVNTSGQQLLVQPVPGQMANLAQALNSSVQPGVKLLNVVQAQQQQRAVQPQNTLATLTTPTSLHQNLTNTQSGITVAPPVMTTSQQKAALTQELSKVKSIDHHGAAPLILLPNEAGPGPVNTASNIQVVQSYMTSVDHTITPTSAISQHQKIVNTPEVLDGCVTGVQLNVSHLSTVGSDVIRKTQEAAHAESISSCVANPEQKAPGQLVLQQHQQQSPQSQALEANTVPASTAQGVQLAAEQDPSQLSLILQQLGCGPGMKLVLNTDGTLASSNLTVTPLPSSSLSQQPNAPVSVTPSTYSGHTQNSLSTSIAGTNIYSISGSQVVLQHESTASPPVNISLADINTGWDNAKRAQVQEANSYTPVTSTATVSGNKNLASSLNLPGQQSNASSLPISNSIWKENSTSVSDQSYREGLPGQDSNPRPRLNRHEVIDLTTDLADSPPSGMTRPEESSLTSTKRHLPHSNLLFQELSKTVVSASSAQSTATTGQSDREDVRQISQGVTEQHSNKKQQLKDLRFVSYQRLQNPPLRVAQHSYQKADASLIDRRTLLDDKLYLPSSLQSSAVGTGMKTSRSDIVEPVLAHKQSCSTSGPASDMVILVPEDFQIQQPLENSGRGDSLASHDMRLNPSDVNACFTTSSLPRVSLPQPKAPQAVTNLAMDQLPVAGPSVALPTPVKSHPVEAPHMFTMSGKQPQIAFSGLTNSPRMMLSQNFSGNPESQEVQPPQNTGIQPSYEKSVSAPLTLRISSSPKLAKPQKTHALTPIPQQISQANPSSNIRRPNSIPIVSAAIPRHVSVSASQTLAFRRTSNTPTDAVGPPNITIVSPSGSSPAHLLKFNAPVSSVNTGPSSVEQHVRYLQEANTGSQTPVSSVDSFTDLTSIRDRAHELNMGQESFEQSKSDKNLTAPAPCKADSVGQRVPKPIEDTQSSKDYKETEQVNVPLKPALATDNSASAYRERLLQCHLNPGLKKSTKPRKRSSTINDLLKMKDLELQAGVSKVSQMQRVISQTTVTDANRQLTVLDVNLGGQKTSSPAPDPIRLPAAAAAQNPEVVLMVNQGTPQQIDSRSITVPRTTENTGKLRSDADRDIATDSVTGSNISSPGEVLATPHLKQVSHQQQNRKPSVSESRDHQQASHIGPATATSQIVSRGLEATPVYTPQRLGPDAPSNVKTVMKPSATDYFDQNKEIRVTQQQTEMEASNKKPCRTEISHRMEPEPPHQEGNLEGLNIRVPTVDLLPPTSLSNEDISEHLGKTSQSLWDPTLRSLLASGQAQVLWASKANTRNSSEQFESDLYGGYTSRAPPAYEEATRGVIGFMSSFHVGPQHEPAPHGADQRASIMKESREMTGPVHCHDRITKVINDIYMPDDQRPSSLYEDRVKAMVTVKPKHQNTDSPASSSGDLSVSQVTKEPRKDTILARKLMSRELDQNAHSWKVPGVQRKLPAKGKGNAHLKRVQFSEDISMQQTSRRLEDEDIVGLKTHPSSSKDTNSKLPFSLMAEYMPASHDQLIFKSVAKQNKRSEQHSEVRPSLTPGFVDYRRHLSQDTLKPTPTTTPLSVVRHSELVSARHKVSKLETKGRSEEVLGRHQYKVDSEIVGKVDHTSSKQSFYLGNSQTSMANNSHAMAVSQEDNVGLRELQDRAGLDTGNYNADSRPSSFEIINPQGYSRYNRQRVLSTTSSESSCSPQVESRPFPSHPQATTQQQQLISEQAVRVPQHTHMLAEALRSSEHDKMYVKEGGDTGVHRHFARDSHKMFGNVSTTAERPMSESPVIRHNVIQEDYELSQQMSQQNFGASMSTKSSFSGYKSVETPPDELLTPLRDEFKSSGLSARSDERELVPMYGPGRIGRPGQPEEEMLSMRVLTHSPSNSSVNSDVAANIISASHLTSSVDGTLERVYDLMESNTKLSNQNEMLRRKVTKAELQAERMQHRHHHSHSLSPVPTPGAASVDSEESGIGVEGEAASSPIQNFAISHTDLTGVLNIKAYGNAGHRRRSKHPSSSGILKQGPSHEPEPDRLLEASTSSGVRRRHLSSGLRVPSDYIETLHRVAVPHASPLSFAAMEMGSPELVINDCLRVGAGDPLVSSSTLRPPSQLDNEISAYNHGFLLSESGQYRQRYPSSSEIKQMPFAQLLDLDNTSDGSHPRNLSSALGFRIEPDFLLSSTFFDNLQRQRNPSTSSLKDGNAAGNGSGNRSRNPSSSSLFQLLKDFPPPLNVIRSRNPSGSSNRRSRPGSSSSDREFPYVNPGDDLISFTDLIHTRSRNSSGDSNLEPTLTTPYPIDIMQIYHA